MRRRRTRRSLGPAAVLVALVTATSLVHGDGGALVSAAALLRSLGRHAWPWIAIATALCLLGFWIVQVPMDMRGAVA